MTQKTIKKTTVARLTRKSETCSNCKYHSFEHKLGRKPKHSCVYSGFNNNFQGTCKITAERPLESEDVKKIKCEHYEPQTIDIKNG